MVVVLPSLSPTYLPTCHSPPPPSLLPSLSLSLPLSSPQPSTRPVSWATLAVHKYCCETQRPTWGLSISGGFPPSPIPSTSTPNTTVIIAHLHTMCVCMYMYIVYVRLYGWMDVKLMHCLLFLFVFWHKPIHVYMYMCMYVHYGYAVWWPSFVQKCGDGCYPIVCVCVCVCVCVFMCAT